jgi:hypothetical protein
MIVNNKVNNITDGKEREHLKLLKFGESINSLKAVQRLGRYYGKNFKEDTDIYAQRVVTKYFIYSCEDKYDEKAKDEAASIMEFFNPQILNISCDMKENASFGDGYNEGEFDIPDLKLYEN